MEDDEIRKIASLCRLALSDQEVEQLKPALTDIINLVARLDDEDTADVEPAAHPLDMVQSMRQDKVTEHNQRERLQASAEAVAKGFYLVPKVIE